MLSRLSGRTISLSAEQRFTIELLAISSTPSAKVIFSREVMFWNEAVKTLTEPGMVSSVRRGKQLNLV